MMDGQNYKDTMIDVWLRCARHYAPDSISEQPLQYDEHMFTEIINSEAWFWTHSTNQKSGLTTQIFEALLQLQSIHPAASAAVISIIVQQLAKDMYEGTVIVDTLCQALRSCPALPRKIIEKSFQAPFEEALLCRNLHRVNMFLSQTFQVLAIFPDRLSDAVLPRFLDFVVAVEMQADMCILDSSVALFLKWFQKFSLTAVAEHCYKIVIKVFRYILHSSTRVENPDGMPEPPRATGLNLPCKTGSNIFESVGIQVLIIFLASSIPENALVQFFDMLLSKIKELEDSKQSVLQGNLNSSIPLKMLMLLLVGCEVVPPSLSKKLTTKLKQLAEKSKNAGNKYMLEQAIFVVVSLVFGDVDNLQGMLKTSASCDCVCNAPLKNKKEFVSNIGQIGTFKSMPVLIGSGAAKQWAQTLMIAQPFLSTKRLKENLARLCFFEETVLAKPNEVPLKKSRSQELNGNDIQEGVSIKNLKNFWEIIPDIVAETVMSYFGHKRLCRMACIDKRTNGLVTKSQLWETLFWNMFFPKLCTERKGTEKNRYLLYVFGMKQNASTLKSQCFDWRSNFRDRLRAKKKCRAHFHRQRNNWKICQYFWCHHIITGAKKAQMHAAQHQKKLLKLAWSHNYKTGKKSYDI